ncbi:isochorismate synthase [Vibrio sp. JC009]|uniref:isochorismate synthase n=1 Tax=Vibrio sp. JC009 TaxID=2912314 RepID=UPI0023AEA72F|nr:isochorismate synthase [Vibrio sp. JC009]WED22608.1 isochorismate synthase [Vibrio sp. JC009]
MSLFKQAISELIEKVKHTDKNRCRISQHFDACTEFSMVDWLEGQLLFPKFYWQSRDTREEVVALGKVHTFSEPAPAYSVIEGEQRIWGGKSFDALDERMPSFFFLPQIELIRRDRRWSLCVNIDNNSAQIADALEQLVVESPELPPVSSQIQSIAHTPELPEWTEMLSDALKCIDENQFKKVVLARKTDVTLESEISAAQLLKASRAKNHRSFHFLLALDENSAFIGSSPERLYSRNDLELETEALAGTSPRSSDEEKDLALANWLTHDHKNLQENQYVVDDIIERLTPLSNSIDIQQEAKLIRLRTVQHLKRKISASLNQGINGVQLLSALQPTAAVAGLPRKASMDYIHQHEPFSRGWYSGSLGYISHKKAEFSVALRSAYIAGNRMELYAGVGIIPGSDADYEWQELDKKMSTLFGLLPKKESDA